MKTIVAVLISVAVAGPASAQSEADLTAKGYRPMACLFDQRCVIGQPCERAWRDMRWLLNDDKGTAFRVHSGGKIYGEALLMKDRRWGDQSEARAILHPMREAVASHLTVFDGGGAIFSTQYAANPGSGQFFLGTCTMTGDAK
jgi:hypothetical protein